MTWIDDGIEALKAIEIEIAGPIYTPYDWKKGEPAYFEVILRNPSDVVVFRDLRVRVEIAGPARLRYEDRNDRVSVGDSFTSDRDDLFGRAVIRFSVVPTGAGSIGISAFIDAATPFLRLSKDEATRRLLAIELA